MTAPNHLGISNLRLSLTPDQGPLYRQLIDQITQAIEQGQLKPGDRLPGSRAMAESLGVSRSTLVNVYERLVAEGILVSRAKSGVFVAEHSHARIQPQQTQPVPQETPTLLSFDSGVDPKAFPLKSWQKSMRASWQQPDPLVLEDAYPSGYPGLKQAIADYLYQLRGLQCSADQIVITAGNRDALSLLRHTFNQISPGSRWCTETPCFQPIRHQLAEWNSTRSRPQPFQLPVDEEGCQLPPADSSPPVVLLTPNRQYPLGIALSSQRRQQWLQALQAEQLWVVEDDYDNEFSYQGRTGIPLMQADRSDRVFFVGSFSKVLFRGLRLGFIVSPPTHCQALLNSRSQLGGSASLPMQPVLTEFMNSGDFGRHINRMRRHYRHKRDQLLALAEQYLQPWFHWHTPHGGMHLIIRFRPEAADRLRPLLGSDPLDQLLAERLQQKGIRLDPLSAHYASAAEQLLQQPEQALEPTEGFILGYTRPDEDSMHRLVHTLAQGLSTRLD
ncbi:PLP-dependent aminotransferase family protein [Marinobacterium stanieri]|uniref:MocR-like pyridoxine biosynthesis transcription factor PdxR n=1 Tax=Marinobacterium stanieri TaxID=49186 RepID=UPI003A8EAB16